MSDESDLIAAFRRIAKLKDGDRFTISHRGVDIQVDYSGGSSSSLSLSAPYDRVAKTLTAEEGKAARYRESAKGGTLVAIRPMLIALREETATDRGGKSEGINREHQTGDEHFDHQVYIDSPTVSDAVLNAVLGPSARAGVMKLLSLGFQTVTVDDMHGDVKAFLNTFSSRGPSEVRADEMLDAFVALTSDLPIVKSSAGTHPKRPLGAFNVGFGIVAGGAVLGAIPGYFMMASAHDCTEASDDEEGQSLKSGCAGPGAMALVVGFVAAIVVAVIARSWLKKRYSGHSSSLSAIATANIIIFILALFSAFYTLSWVFFERR